MKLRNKKTGEIQEIVVMPVVEGYPDEHAIVDGETSLEEFNKVWEDYVPKEPLIKDEKIRKVVRAWAEANEYGLDKGLDYTEYVGNYGCSFATYGSDDNEIHFCKKLGLEDGRDYTIAELCGEEEE